jgi:hypothetical protein
LTLDEWTALTPGERNRERRTWPRDEGYWLDLLHEATDRFKGEFGGHPLINHIDHSAWYSAASEPAILVVTALWSPQRIEELPDRYHTFGVLQEPILGNKDCYLREWNLVLGELLGWSETRVREWARQNWEDGLDGKDSVFYHEDPIAYVVDLLIPQPIRERVCGLPYVQLRSHLHQAIQRYGSSPLWLSPYDWKGARERIDAILSEYAEPRSE